MPPPPPTTLDFDDPQWNAQRAQLEGALIAAAIELVHHMGSPQGTRGTIEHDMDDGRSLRVILEAGPRPQTN